VGILRRHPCASQLLISSEKRTSEAAPDFHYRLGIDMFIAGVQALSQQVTSHQSA